MDNPGPKLLWKHRDPTSTRLFQFKKLLESKYEVDLEDYDKLRQWSILNINRFWEEVWHFTGIKASKPFIKVLPMSVATTTGVDEG